MIVIPLVHETCVECGPMCSILFISSDSSAREWWCRALQTRGREGVVREPGLEALVTATKSWEAIVVDVELTIEWQHFRVLGQEKERLMAPLIVLTSWSAPGGRYRQMAFGMGCDAFVSKPCTVDGLLEVIDRLASGERRIQATGTP